MSRHWKKAALIIVLAAFLLLYASGAMMHADMVNLAVGKSDQDAYLGYAKSIAEKGFDHIGGRNRMPLYPFLLSWSYQPELDPQEHFDRGKRFNVRLSMLLLAAIYLVLHRCLGGLAAASLILVTAFTVFVFKAGYVQCELLYYFLSFCTFVLMCATLARPDWKLGVATGLLAGLSHLTKNAVLPALVLFLSLGGVWFVAVSARRGAAAGRKGVLAVVLAAATFLVVVYPYISTSKKLFGSYFYNVNTTFYMWYDTYEEYRTGTRMHGDRSGWPDMPEGDIPGPARYFREHSTGDILGRVGRGFAKIHDISWRSFGYYKFFLLYALVAAVALLVDWKRLSAAEDRAPLLLLFFLCYMGGYLLLYAWIIQTNYGVARLVLQVFLPAMFFFAVVIGRSPSIARTWLRIGRFPLSGLQIFNILVILLLLFDLPDVFASRLLTMYAGE